MEFIDHTGHIFSLADYSTYPVGYEYDEHPYVFWFDNMFGTNLSIDCFYIKPIKLLIPVQYEDEIQSIDIHIEKSNHFKLISSKLIQNRLEQNKSIIDDVEINESEILNHLSKNDLLIVENLSDKVYTYNNAIYYGDIDITDKGVCMKNTDIPLIEEKASFCMIPFYVTGNVSEIGTWMTNVLIHVTYNNSEYYCPITVGGVFYDECEELTINGKNIGLNLPKDIVRSLYSTNFDTESIDYTFWNQKIREYFLHLMKIRSEKGNFRSAIYSLKWFGYGDKLSISKLLQTDNELTNQYILDNFDINSDIIASFNLFRNSTYISLSLQGVTYTSEKNGYNWDKDFFGEDQFKLENLFNKTITTTYDEGDIQFFKSYYNYTFNELGLKLSCLKYYYEKYFLPIHLKVYRVSITEQTFAPKIKLLTATSSHYTEKNLYVYDKNINVIFPEDNTIWINSQTHYIDENFNEFTDTYKNSTEYLYNDAWYINDTCFSIPIKFTSILKEQCYKCVMLFYKDDKQLFEKSFYWTQTKECDYNCLVIYPKLFNKDFDIIYWEDSNYTILLNVNGNWYEWNFKVKVPELDIQINKLEYVYDYNLCKQINGIKDNKILFNTNMYIPDFVNVNNLNYIHDLIDYMRTTGLKYVNQTDVLKDTIYYYYFDDNGNKIILSSDDIKTSLKLSEKQNSTNDYRWVYTKSTTNDMHKLIEIASKEFLSNFNRNIVTSNPNDITYEEYKNRPYLRLISSISKTYELVWLHDELDKHEIYSSVQKNIYSFIDLYSEEVNIPENNNLMNKIYAFDLFILDTNGSKQHIKYDCSKDNKSFRGIDEISITLEDGTVLKFGDNTSEDIINLYKSLYNPENGDFSASMFGAYNNDWKFVSEELNQYDWFLMHDNDVWYFVAISKNTVSNTTYLDFLYKTYKLSSSNTSNEYYLSFIGSDKKLLINRMNIVDMNGKYHFNANDMIVCRVVNNDRLPFKLSVGNKWNINPVSIGIDNFTNISSNSNVALISIGDNFKYEPGFYEVEVTYSLDNFVNNAQKRKTKFRVI